MALTIPVPASELSATAYNRRTEVVDNIFKGTPFLAAMSRYGGVENETGGVELVQPIRMAKNTSVGSFTNYDILDVTPQDAETSAIYPWSGAYATITISWMEQKKNMGRHQIFSLLNQKIDDAGDTLRDKLNIYALQAQPAAGSKDPVSITELVDVDSSADPARTKSIGSIGNANTWWRNKYDTTTGAFTVSAMNTMVNNVSDGHDFPTFILTGQTPYEYYENSLVGQIRYQDSRAGDQGFKTLMYKDIPMLWDPQIGLSDAMYFLNTKYYKMCVHPDGDFEMEEFVKPANQAAMTAKILWMGNFSCSNRRRCGVLAGITAPA